MPCRFFDLLSHIIVTIQVEDISDKIKSVLVVLDICIEPSKIKAVREVVLVNLAEVFVASRRNELQVDL